ncbi:hypothetical protein L596_016509 [Steinernema carpocapsae]|uniref:G-protein coupled receptors family 1 profile domain-containing protein n=1 Tax=Steinernema carpocapsae TaxID=34508 RepID=A0A4U5NJ23_STECR|nr:hypothetical protein L596_016509 [Steinernema carpocapsae]
MKVIHMFNMVAHVIIVSVSLVLTSLVTLVFLSMKTEMQHLSYKLLFQLNVALLLFSVVCMYPFFTLTLQIPFFQLSLVRKVRLSDVKWLAMLF